ncbi:putative pectate lyase A [Paramyrothecium foliicola]|nr:putative pectate lyase A [Paramyrothecium foliicola]
MHYYTLLALLPVALGCTNPKSNSCASFMSANPATAGPFCATFTQNVVTATAALPAWATNCKNKPKEISKECSCYYTGGPGEPPVSTEQPPSSTQRPPTTIVTSTTTRDNPPVETGNCGAANEQQLVGFGVGTTGGGSSGGTTVTSCSALTAAAKSGGVIRISGMLNGCGVIAVSSQTTFLGVGANSGLTNGGFRLKDVTNVIFRNLVLSRPPSGKDIIDIETSTYVWIDHCDLSAEGLVGDKDYYDGLADAKRESDFITISWTKFHDHWKASLIGHSDSASSDKGRSRITYHHNLWSNINSRAPSLRFGTAHIYSSCYEDVPTSGINSRMGANVLVEHNSFTNTNLAIVTDLDSDLEGYANERNNLFINSNTRITQKGSWTAPYSYTIDPASCICSLVKSRAGTGKINV